MKRGEEGRGKTIRGKKKAYPLLESKPLKY